MTDKELKYKFKSPTTTQEERLEAIYEELSKVENSDSYLSKRTLKSYIYQILNHIRRADRFKENKEKSEDYNESWALGFLSVIAVILIYNGSHNSEDYDWLQQSSFSLKLWGIALVAIYLGASIERSLLFKGLWKFNFTKLVVSVSLSGLVVFSTGKAAGLINLVFGIDASAFPFTLVFTSGLIVFHYLLPLMFLVGIAALIHTFIVLSWLKVKFSKSTYEPLPYNSFAFSILAIIFFVLCIGWSENEFSEKQLPEKIYKLAHLLDFNALNKCSNIKKDIPLVFLGASQNMVLADMYAPNISNMKSFFERQIDVPSEFFRLKCELSSNKDMKI